MYPSGKRYAGLCACCWEEGSPVGLLWVWLFSFASGGAPVTCFHHLAWLGGCRLYWLQRRSQVTRFSSLHQPRRDKWVPDCHLECGKCGPGLWHVCGDLNWSSHCIKNALQHVPLIKADSLSKSVVSEWLRCCLSLGHRFRSCYCFLLLLSLPGRAVAALCSLAYFPALSLQVCPCLALSYSVMLL